MRKLIATTAFLTLAGTTVADGIILEQLHNFDGGLASERNTSVTLATTADDFIIGDKNLITSLMATFLVTTDPRLVDWEFDIYAHGDGEPGDLIAVGSGGTATDTGDTSFGLAVHEILFKGINIDLEPGTYWIGVRGVGQNQGERAFWAEANTGDVNGYEAMLKSEFFGFPEWTPWSQLVGTETEVAFTLYGVPAPGTLALLGVAGLAVRRRRRA